MGLHLDGAPYSPVPLPVMKRPARIERHVPLPSRKPNERERPRHRAYINTLPCIACGRAGPSECAHIRAGTDGGMGYKPADRFCLPLCGPNGCHARQHAIGEMSFWGALGIDPLDYAARLWAVTGDHDAGLRTILRAHQAINLHRRNTGGEDAG